MVLRNKFFRFLLFALLFVSLSRVSHSSDENCHNVFSTVKDEVYHRVFNDKPLFIKDYQGQEGYLRFIEGLQKALNMNYVFKLVFEILNEKEKKDLDWQQFQGTTQEFKELRDKVLDEDGNVKLKYVGMEGYAVFADTYFTGDMQKTYKNISAVLDKGQMKQTGWQQFHGTTKEFKELRGKILDEDGNVKFKYVGMEGYAVFADTYFTGDMHKTYLNISAVLDKGQMNQTGWQSFHGVTKEFKGLRDKILDEDGDVKLKYVGMDGYAVFSDTYFNGEMQKTYQNISAVLDKSQMKQTGLAGFFTGQQKSLKS